MNQVEVMHPEVSHLATGIIIEPAEAIEGPILIIRDLGRGAKPAFPIEIGWWIFVRRPADASRPFVLNVKRAGNRHLADAAAENEFGQLAAEWDRAPMNADLTDALVPLNDLHHATALRDAQRE